MKLFARLHRDGSAVGFTDLDQDPVALVPPGEIDVELVRWTGAEYETLQRRTVRAVLGQETPVDFDLTAPKK
jgi:hypothetical protein